MFSKVLKYNSIPPGDDFRLPVGGIVEKGLHNFVNPDFPYKSVQKSENLIVQVEFVKIIFIERIE